MDHTAWKHLLELLNRSITPLDDSHPYSSLLDQIGDARFVLMGEATHGTQEFYQARIEITKLLIQQKGFMAIAIEGDWPDVYSIHRYLSGTGNQKDEKEPLKYFKRFPSWMWNNTTLPPFLNWLRNYNDHHIHNKIGFYGLDLYSLYSSMQAVIDYLDKVDQEAAQHARLRYACFDHMQQDPQVYGYSINSGAKNSCIKEATQQLTELQNHAFEYIKKDNQLSAEEFFYAAQNARLVKDAEQYYRAMFESNISSWNLRDKHMAETINFLADHLEKQFKKPAKIIVWAHNSHVGDARATEMGIRDELNLGQLIREQYDNEVFLLGFSTYQGTVTAATNWGAPAKKQIITPGLSGSYEDLFHQLAYPNFLLNLRNESTLEHYLKLERLQRAIGVVYRPDTERQSHYFFTKLPYQFDSVIHFDVTTAVEPL